MAPFMLLIRRTSQFGWSPEQASISCCHFSCPFLRSYAISVNHNIWVIVVLTSENVLSFITTNLQRCHRHCVLSTSAGVVTTIAGGSNRTGHNDGEGSEVTFSNDFDVTYLRSTCTLVIADRGNRMIREIQLPQFIGRCSGASPNSPGSTFTSRLWMKSYSHEAASLPLIAFSASYCSRLIADST